MIYKSLTITCPCCSYLVSKTASECPMCDWKINAPCKSCNAQIPFQPTSCPVCGEIFPFKTVKSTIKLESKADNVVIQPSKTSSLNYQAIVLIGATIIVLMGLFPPWTETKNSSQNVTSHYSIGYDFLLAPPQKRNHNYNISIDWSLLGLQWAIVSIAFGCAGWMASRRELKEMGKTPSESSYVNYKQEDKIPLDTSQDRKFLKSVHHPWRRFFARYIDSLGLDFAIFIIILAMIESPIIILTLVILFPILLEAALLSTTGTTIGKWLFGISVRTKTGQKLSFSQALSRTVRALVQGAGLGIPIVALFTHFFAYKRLVNTGTTLWDTEIGSVTSCKTLGLTRTILYVIAVFLFFIFTSIGYYLTDSLTLIQNQKNKEPYVNDFVPEHPVLFDPNKPFEIIEDTATNVPNKSVDEAGDGFDPTEPFMIVPMKSYSIEWYNKGLVFEKKNDRKGLLNNALLWTKAQPSNAEAWINLGYTYGKSNPSKAIEAYQMAIRINPEDWATLHNIDIIKEYLSTQ